MKIWLEIFLRVKNRQKKTLCSCATAAANSSAAGPPPIAATAKGPACCSLSSNMLISFQKSLGQVLNIDVWTHELESSVQVSFTVGLCFISVQVDLQIKNEHWVLHHSLLESIRSEFCQGIKSHWWPQNEFLTCVPPERATVLRNGETAVSCVEVDSVRTHLLLEESETTTKDIVLSCSI